MYYFCLTVIHVVLLTFVITLCLPTTALLMSHVNGVNLGSVGPFYCIGNSFSGIVNPDHQDVLRDQAHLALLVILELRQDTFVLCTCTYCLRYLKLVCLH